MPNIEFEKESIGGILTGKRTKFVRVPPNQREYSWEREHVKYLLDDLQQAIDNDEPEYFLGTIIVIQREKFYEVYDGQQRLATSVILLSAIRDYFFEKHDSERVTGIAGRLLRSTDMETLDPEPHLYLSTNDQAFFVDYVLRNPDEEERIKATPGNLKESHQRIMDAVSLAKERIRNIVDSKIGETQKTAQLLKWIKFLDDGARVIWVEVQNDATAYRIFETMNDRGLDLSAADLIKNYLFSQAGERSLNEINDKWQGMLRILETLGSEDGNVVNYIRYLWITENGHTRIKNLFDELKTKIQGRTKAVGFVTKLEQRAQDFTAIVVPSHDTWKGYHQDVASRIITLKHLNVKQIRILLLAALKKFKNSEMKKLFDASVNWSVRCLLSGIPPGTLETAYAKAAKAITDGSIVDVQSLTSSLLTTIPDDAKFRSSVETANVSQERLARYYLNVLQKTDDGGSEPQYVPSEEGHISLEHILPQKPGNGWGHFSPEEVRVYCSRLGNQALLVKSENNIAGNDDYASVKRAILNASEYSLTRAAAGYEKWTIETITNRQRELAVLAVKAWPLR